MKTDYKRQQKKRELEQEIFEMEKDGMCPHCGLHVYKPKGFSLFRLWTCDCVARKVKKRGRAGQNP